MKYVIFAEYEDAKISVETNEVEVLFAEAERHRGCPHLCIASGETGEVLFHTGDEPYCTDEFALMAIGWLVSQFWDEEEDEGETAQMACLPFIKPGTFVPLLDPADEITNPNWEPKNLLEILGKL